jgi:hypothetical protein
MFIRPGKNSHPVSLFLGVRVEGDEGLAPLKCGSRGILVRPGGSVPFLKSKG